MPVSPHIGPEQLARLPEHHRATVPPAFLDSMGHMNIRYYMALYDEAVWSFFASFGLDAAFTREHRVGAWALEQHIRYLAEVRAGQTVSVRVRALGRSEKRIHFMPMMINVTGGMLASTLEVLGTFAHLDRRRSTAVPAAIAGPLDALIAVHAALPWPAPVCGVLQP